MNPIRWLAGLLRKRPSSPGPGAPVTLVLSGRPAVRAKLREQAEREAALVAATRPTRKILIIRGRRARKRKGVKWTPERK
jgi:hypothetical protein